MTYRTKEINLQEAPDNRYSVIQCGIVVRYAVHYVVLLLILIIKVLATHFLLKFDSHTHFNIIPHKRTLESNIKSLIHIKFLVIHISSARIIIIGHYLDIGITYERGMELLHLYNNDWVIWKDIKNESWKNHEYVPQSAQFQKIKCISTEQDSIGFYCRSIDGIRKHSWF